MNTNRILIVVCLALLGVILVAGAALALLAVGFMFSDM